MLPSGTYIFVHPNQYQNVVNKLNGQTLYSSHVVVSATWESVLDQVVTTGVRHREILAVPTRKQRKIETATAELAEVTLSDDDTLCGVC